MLSDTEVIHHLTIINHLELRVKNVATMNLIQQVKKRETNNIRESLKNVIEYA